MCAEVRTALAVSAFILVGMTGCMRLDPALLEGRWSLNRIVLDSTSAIAAASVELVSALVHGTTIEFRGGQLLVPLVSDDTLRFDYRITMDTLQLRAGTTIVEQLRIVRLDDDELQLERRRLRIVFRRI
ncbi:MAG: hypothetical protein N2663_08585 [Chlorobi bacterium]|nr:hypothetical protein [Chlorobiota bacterium]